MHFFGPHLQEERLRSFWTAFLGRPWTGDLSSTSGVWSKELSRIGAERRLATTGHPQCNGVAENTVGLAKAKEILPRYRDKRRWAEVLPEVALALNTWPSRFSGASPYFILFGQTPPLSVESRTGTLTGAPPAGQHLAAFKREMEKIEQSRAKERKKMEKDLNRRRGQRVFAPGDEVLLDMLQTFRVNDVMKPQEWPAFDSPLLTAYSDCLRMSPKAPVESVKPGAIDTSDKAIGVLVIRFQLSTSLTWFLVLS